MGLRSLEEGRERRLTGLLYAVELVICDKSENLKVMIINFVGKF